MLWSIAVSLGLLSLLCPMMASLTPVISNDTSTQAASDTTPIITKSTENITTVTVTTESTNHTNATENITTVTVTTESTNHTNATTETTTAFVTTQHPVVPEKLVQIAVLFRHGDRTPTKKFPSTSKETTDLNWPEGLGELTAKGEAQMKTFGKTLRDTYITSRPGELPADYTLGNRKFIQAHSSSVTRCLMSAENVLAGLYPDQRVPISSQPVNEDYLLEGDDVCGYYESELEKIMHSDDVKDIENKFKVEFGLLGKLTNWTDFNLQRAWDTWDILNCQQKHVNDSVRDINVTAALENHWSNLTLLQHQQWTTKFNSSKHTQQAKYVAGLLLRQVTDLMTNKTNATFAKDTPSVSLFSAHDTNIAAMLQLLNGTENEKDIEYGDYIVFELWEGKNEYAVDVRYNSMDSGLLSNHTPLKDFVEQTKSVTFKDHDETVSECSKSSSSISRDQIIAIVLGCLLLLVIVIGVGCFIAKRRRSPGGYALQVDG